MGEVYRARDTRLDRTVAIKILPEALAADPQFRERFDREARTISQLDHPHICALHDVGEQDGTAYLVMQYLEGDTLDQRLGRGPLPLPEALRVAIDLADALDKAHRAGIIHRDLKPSNIKLTKSGAKLLDFGLAKTTAPLITGVAVTLAPTSPAGLTAQGTILGTLQYMSPEQLEGHDADVRSDVFAFGAVLYEMLTGTRAFTGKSQASIVSAILKDTPPPASQVQPLVPARVDRVVMTCLEKDRDDRWQSMRDLRRELEWLSGAAAAEGSSPSRAVSRRWYLPWLIAATAIASAAIFLVRDMRRPTSTPATSRLLAGLPADAAYDNRATPGRALAIAPDARRVVYSGFAAGAAGPPQRQLYKRDLDRLTVESIAGTEGAYQPFFSPDGQSVAFFTIAGELKRVALSGGPPTTLVHGLQNGQWSFGAWRDDDLIVFSAFANLLQVSANGGTPTPLTNLTDGGVTDLWHQYPAIVPSTGDVIFTVYTAQARRRLDILRWSDKRRSILVEDATGAVVTSGHVLFTRDGTVMAAAFNAATASAGAATPISEAVIVEGQGIAQLGVARDGTLAYVPPDADAPAPALGWMSRTGTFTEIAQLQKGVDDLALSPDGRFAVLMTYGSSKVSIFDLERHVSTPVNLEGRQVESASWHPDGRRVTFGGAYLSLFDPDRGVETRLTPIGRPKRFASWTPDGRQVTYMTFEPANDIYTVSLDQDGKPAAPRPLIATSAVEANPAISPDGRWIAYRAADPSTGRTDVYLARFPDGSGRIQVTSNGGGAPFWSRKNDELFFTAPPGAVQSVPVSLGDRAQVGTPRTLFPLTELEALSVSSDGTRFLVLKQRPLQRPRQIVIVQNWLSELTRLVPVR
jgi:Tol biopolymer transport system component